MTKSFRHSSACCFEKPNPILDELRYFCYGVEQCPTTGRIHYQYLALFKDKVTVKRAQRIIGAGQCKILPCVSKYDVCRHYCLKDYTHDHCQLCNDKCDNKDNNHVYCREILPANINVLFEFVEFGELKNEQGKRGEQGKRNDLIKLGEKIKNNEELSAPEIIKYHRGIKEYKAIVDQKKSQHFRNLTVNVLVGESGKGKTRYVYDLHGYDNVYKLDKCGNEVWFDGYDGQKVLLIDDFYGWIHWGHLLNILDGYPLRLQIKGSHTWAQYETVYITSNRNVEDWYHRDDISALKRRITNYIDI